MHQGYPHLPQGKTPIDIGNLSMGSIKSILKNSFTIIAIITYSIGMVGHILVLLTGQAGSEMPNAVHWIVLLLAGYAGLGFLINFKIIPFVNLLDKMLYLLVMIHLLSSALIHLYSILFQTNNWLKVFDYSYSYFAVVYFALFGYYSFRLHHRLRVS